MDEIENVVISGVLLKFLGWYIVVSGLWLSGSGKWLKGLSCSKSRSSLSK